MKIDESIPDTAQATRQVDRQNRREFFNGLGKWSMIVVAAVSFLRGSATGSQASHEETPRPEPAPQRPAWAMSEDSRENLKVAKRPYVKGGGHGNDYFKSNDPHTNTPHVNHKIIQ
jgi:hypothetical protein